MASTTADLPLPPVWQERHSLIARFAHWVRLLALLALLMSGLQIFNAYPRLHWGHIGSDHDPAWLEIGASGERGYLRVGQLEVTTTGFLGRSGPDEARATVAYPGWATIPAVRDLSAARRWHFFWAWVFVLNGLLYLSVEIASGRFQRRLLPRRAELAPAHLGHEISTHARLIFPRGETARDYNVLQKLTYLAVLLGLLPLMLLTGLAMSPGFTAAVPVDALFGGRQSARSLHWIGMNLLIAFVLIHVALVLLAGPWNLLRSMVTGRFAIAQDRW